MRNDAKLVVWLAVALCLPVSSQAQSAAAPANSSSTTVPASPATTVSGPRKFVIGTAFANGDYSSSNYDSSSDISTDVYKSTTHSGSGSISPTLGIFLNDRLVVGSALSFSLSHSNSESGTNGVSDGTSKSHSIYLSIGPFLRKYFGNPQGRGMPFLHAEGGLGFNIYGGTYSPVSGTGYDYKQQNYRSWYAQFLLGYEMFLTELLGLEYYGGYYYNSYSYDYFYDYVSSPDSTYHYKGKSNEALFGIGLRVYLHGRK